MTTISTSNVDQASGHKPKLAVRIFAAIARILMGLLFVFAGSNGFFHYVPQPPNVPDFAVALMKTGYMFPLIFGTQLIAGLLFLANRFVPFAVVLIAPVVVHIVAFHIFIDRSGLPVAIIVLGLEVFLTWAYWKTYRAMFVAKATPGAR